MLDESRGEDRRGKAGLANEMGGVSDDLRRALFLPPAAAMAALAEAVLVVEPVRRPEVGEFRDLLSPGEERLRNNSLSEITGDDNWRSLPEIDADSPSLVRSSLPSPTFLSSSSTPSFSCLLELTLEERDARPARLAYPPLPPAAGSVPALLPDSVVPVDDVLGRTLLDSVEDEEPPLPACCSLPSSSLCLLLLLLVLPWALELSPSPAAASAPAVVEVEVKEGDNSGVSVAGLWSWSWSSSRGAGAVVALAAAAGLAGLLVVGRG